MNLDIIEAVIELIEIGAIRPDEIVKTLKTAVAATKNREEAIKEGRVLQ